MPVNLLDARRCLSAEWAGPRLRLDLDGIELLSAAQLGRLVSLHRAARECGAALKLVHVGPRLLEEFEATGLTRVFDIAPRCGQ